MPIGGASSGRVWVFSLHSRLVLISVDNTKYTDTGDPSNAVMKASGSSGLAHDFLHMLARLLLASLLLLATTL